ncbi:DUF6458 family protein [Subtercola lobariae]|uniref:DUF6458 domain-containing protein n=1 Tax=Subtercola lobariae TaxID=1588641 RepID=A0A917B593_9MICO|nr:DUF6458 family protein [Subtercola lobariae]GGF22806.1 hypothetical protein GCM10011399_15570 [Subtercola lobariae]
MSLGSGIALFVVGAILAFAVNIQESWIDLQLVGYILMAAGVLGIILGVVLITRRRQTTMTTRSAVDPVSGEQVSRRTVDHDDPLV